MDDFGYDHYGWFGFTVELWDAPTEAGIKKEDYVRWFKWHSPEDDYQLMQWNDQALSSDGFVPWQPFDHPQLGAVELGGWKFKSVWQNAPAQYLPELCEKQLQFAIAHTLYSPRLALARAEVKAQGETIFQIVVQWENQGFLPTYTSQKALERKAVRPIEVVLTLPESVTLISGSLKQEIPHLEGRSNKAFSSLAAGIDYRHHLQWVVKGPKGAVIEVTAYAERAGTVQTTLTLS
jgi:murein tripeptide amidase MpaA